MVQIDEKVYGASSAKLASIFDAGTFVELGAYTKRQDSQKDFEGVVCGYGSVNGTHVNLRSGAGTSYNVVIQANKGDKVYIIGLNTGWYKVIYNNKICYIRSRLSTTTRSAISVATLLI